MKVIQIAAGVFIGGVALYMAYHFNNAVQSQGSVEIREANEGISQSLNRIIDRELSRCDELSDTQQRKDCYDRVLEK